MKILWFSVSPSLYGDNIVGGKWVVSLQQIIMKHCPDIQLAVAFEHDDDVFKVEKDGVYYYPMSVERRQIEKLYNRYFPYRKEKMLLEKMKQVVDDYQPDLIQCFGSEWRWGLIKEYAQCPVVIHMQGFLNIYNLSSSMAKACLLDSSKRSIKERIKDIFKKSLANRNDAMERKVMQLNKHFLVRTQWDRDISKYYGHKDAHIMYCPEAIRPEIYDAHERWTYKERHTMQIVSISSGAELKGNEIIFRAAQILKSFGFDFKWTIAGNKQCIEAYGNALGIKACDVNINLIGYIDGQKVSNYLKVSDVYVHAAIIDNSPNSLCEAQLMGCPVVTSYVGGIPDLVKDGETGIFFPYNEPHTLAFKLMNLHNDRELSEYLSQNEIKVSHERHNPITIAETLHNIYTQIINDYEQN